MTANAIGQHDLLLSMSAAGLGWWTECECGWISRGYRSEGYALSAHEAHQARMPAVAL